MASEVERAVYERDMAIASALREACAQHRLGAASEMFVYVLCLSQVIRENAKNDAHKDEGLLLVEQKLSEFVRKPL